jgi:Spy/CpxP family protein refolding chaperone
MKRIGFVVALLSMVIGSANILHAQKPAPKTEPVVSLPDLSHLSIGTAMEQMQTTAITGGGEAPSPIQIVVQFLQLQPDQVQAIGQLLQARQAALAPLLQGIQQRVLQLEALLNSGANPAQVGILAIQIYALQHQVARVQQGFLSNFANLLDPEQQQQLEAVRIAAPLQPVLPAFQQLYLF